MKAKLYKDIIHTRQMIVPIGWAAKSIGGAQGKYEKWGPTKWIMCGGSGGTPPRNFEILHALKCVLALLRLFYVNAKSTFIPASCSLRLVVLD